MKHAVIVGHPNPRSFTKTIAQAYCEAVAARGHTVDLRDLDALGFDPRMRAEELLGAHAFGPAADVSVERARLKDADVFVLVYPLWFNAPPALLKGYLDRVFAMGFGYGSRKDGTNPPLLSGRLLLTLTSSGAPAEWLAHQETWGAIRILFERHFAAVCGLTVLDHIHFGGVHPGMSTHAVERAVADVEAAVARLF